MSLQSLREKINREPVGKICVVTGQYKGIVLYSEGDAVREFIQSGGDLADDGITSPIELGIWIADTLYFTGGGRSYEGDYNDVYLNSKAWRRPTTHELVAISEGKSPFEVLE